MTDSSPVFRKSSYSSNTGQCVEVAATNGSVAVRDSNNPDGAVLVFTQGQWAGLIKSVLGESLIARKSPGTHVMGTGAL
jgi:hypothetical protein